jgi:hypothetical protein
VKNFWAQISGDIPEGWRVCGENMFAQHSIIYDDLESYFYGFSIWDERNNCLDWDLTQEYFKLMDIVSVEVLYDGIYDEKAIRAEEKKLDFTKDEGYVIRTADGFSYANFRHSMAKFVRANHVQPSAHHWRMKKVVPNNLKA